MTPKIQKKHGITFALESNVLSGFCHHRGAPEAASSHPNIPPKPRAEHPLLRAFLNSLRMQILLLFVEIACKALIQIEKKWGPMKNQEKIVEALNQVLEWELAGVVRYTHYSLMVFGHNRIPIVKWLNDQALESLSHASQAGEHITTLGGHPSLKIGKLTETHKHSLTDILKESLAHEVQQLENLRTLLALVEGQSVYLEEYARDMICDEEAHLSEVEKMLRTQPK